MDTSVDELVDRAAEGARMIAELMQRQQAKQQDGELAQQTYVPESAQQPARPATSDADTEATAEEEHYAEFE